MKRTFLLIWLAWAGCTTANPQADGPRPTDAALPQGDAASPARDAAEAPDLATPPDLSPGTPATVTVTRTGPLTPLGSAFAGLSYEKGTLPTPLFSGTNTDLIALFKRLGPSVLRVGGNSVDENTWNGSGPGLQPGTIAPADVDRLSAFLQAAGWKVIYGVNMGHSNPASAAAEATYAAQSLGPALLGFEIGNEPDLYATNGDRPATYTYADFQTEWQSFAAAIRQQVPAAPLTGPAAAYNYEGWTIPFAAAEASRIILLTQHYYVANGQDPTSTIQKLLMPDPALVTELAALKPAAQNAKISGGFRMAEANSYYNGGAPGVSDSFGSALWAINFLFTLAQGGATGVNFHGGGDGPGYTPIADNNGQVVGPRPEYYGISLFDLAAQGKLLTTAVKVTGVALSAYAVEPADGSTAVVLVNPDSTEFVKATVDLGKAATTATLTALTAPALDSTTGVLLGGAPINADGTWTPASQPTAPVVGQTVTVNVAPASALLVSAK